MTMLELLGRLIHWVGIAFICGGVIGLVKVYQLWKKDK